ncbi:MAG: MBL fold metallo-hydrolase [Bacteroidota bacterium]
MEEIKQIELALDDSFPTVNSYLVIGEELSLVDCGHRKDPNWESFQSAIREYGYELSDISSIFLTHHHTDHIGLLPKILQQTKAKVFAPIETKAYLENFDGRMQAHMEFQQQLLRETAIPAAVLNAIADFMNQAREFMNDLHLPEDNILYFKHGDKLSIGGGNYLAYHTPGHCYSQYCFVNHDHQHVFGGDMLLPLTPMPILEEYDGKRIPSLSQLMESYERLLEFNFRWVFPGHGAPFQDASEMIHKQMTRLLARREQCYQSILEGASSLMEIMLSMYPGIEKKMNFGALFMAFGYVDLLIAEGRVYDELDENGVRRFALTPILG